MSLAQFGSEELPLADPMESPPLVVAGNCIDQEPRSHPLGCQVNNGRLSSSAHIPHAKNLGDVGSKLHN